LVVLFVLENNKNGKLENNKTCSNYFENKNGSYRDMVPIWKIKMAAPVTWLVLENNKDGQVGE
jgi:hypothetical protein